MDGITAYLMSTELDALLAGSRLDRISMEDRLRLTLTFFTPQRARFYLNLLSNPSRPSLQISQTSPGQGLNPPPSLVMLMRKHLRGAQLQGIESPVWERVFIFHFSALDDLGDPRELKLIFECMPRTANLILVNHEEVILGALRHIDHRLNRVRETLPAHPYIPPPSQNRLDLAQAVKLETDQWFQLFPKDQKPARAITQALAGFSPRLGMEALFRAGLDPDLPLGQLDPKGRQDLARALEGLCQEILSGQTAPAIYFEEPRGGKDLRPLAVHAIQLKHLPHARPYDKISQAVSDYNRQRDKIDRFDSRKRAIEKRVSEAMKRVDKKRQVHEADLAEGKEADQDRLCGELILAYLHTIPPGSEGVSLDNYYQAGSQVFCSLDPHRTAADNANRYFARAKRKERKYKAASQLLANDLDEIQWLESLRAAAGYSQTLDDLRALEEEYQSRKEGPEKSKGPEAGPRTPPGRPASKKRRMQQTFEQYRKKEKSRPRTEEGLSPRRYRSSDGFLISCGRNNLQNDQLLRKADRHDLWFHVKDRPGSHVFISLDQGEASPMAMEEAAGIAAWFSSAGRGGSPVEVDYTRVSEVKKIPGSRPGNVRYQKHKTIYVKPLDPSSLERV